MEKNSYLSHLFYFESFPKSVTLILLVDPSDRDYRVYILIRDVKYCYFYNLVLLQVHVRLVTIHLMTKTLISGLILSKLLNQNLNEVLGISVDVEQ